MATRRERVVLELEDLFTPDMARAAAATALLKRELKGLSGSAVETDRTTRQLSRDTDQLATSASKGGKEVDKLSGRMKILADVMILLGPAAAPITSVAIPAITGLSSEIGFAVTAAGVAVLAFHGMGDALKAVNKAAIEPTEQNLQAARVALDQLSPSARAFVGQLQALAPELKHLQELAGDGLFPGLSEGLTDMETALPRVERVITAISTELGHIGANAGESIGSGRWDDFLDFLSTEGPAALGDMSKAAGNTIHALTNLWMATTPLNDDFSTWLVNSTAKLDMWTEGLSKTEGFHDFVAYVEKEGPEVAQTFDALAHAALQIGEAISPLGGPVLQTITSLANVVGKIADSDLGTPIFGALFAYRLLNRTLSVTGPLQKAAFGGSALTDVTKLRTGIRGLAADLALMNRKTTNGGFIGPLNEQQTATLTTRQAEEAAARGRVQNTAVGLGKTAALLTAIGVASTGAADSLGVTNTTSLALAGTMAGPEGAALGAVAGAFLDVKKASDSFTHSIKDAQDAIDTGDIDKLTAALADLKSKSDDLNHTNSIKDAIGDAKNNFLGGDTLYQASHAGPVGILANGVSHLFGGGDIGTSGKDRIADSVKTDQIALDNLQKTLAATDATTLRVNGLEATKVGLDQATESAQTFNATLDNINANLSQQSAIDSYKAALDDFDKGLKENGKTLDNNTEKGRANRESLIQIGTSAVAVANTLTNDTNKRIFLDEVREKFIKAAIAAGDSKKAAQDFANSVLGLNAIKGVPKIDINDLVAKDKITTLQRTILGLTDKTHTVTVGVKVKTPPGYDPGLSQLLGQTTGGDGKKGKKGSADGGSVPKTGMPYADRHPYLLADGEEVISNRHGQADRNRSLLKAINAGMLADGGTTGRSGGGISQGLADYIRTDLGRSLPRTLKEWTASLSKSKSVIDKETQARDDLVSKRQNLIDTVTGNFTSSVFDKGNRPSNWQYLSADARKQALQSNPFSTLNTDITNAGEFGTLLTDLSKKKGLSGGAFNELAASGDIEQAQALDSLSNTKIAQLNALYARREKAAGTVAAYAGATGYNKQIAETNTHLKAMQAQNKALQSKVDHLEKSLKGAAKSHAAEVTARGKASRGARAASVRTRKKGG